MYKIGDFSKMSKVTIKALRYYEKEKLLIPCYIDNTNGYRYYESNQLVFLSKIILLKQVGLSIEEIKKVIIESIDINDIAVVKEKTPYKENNSIKFKELEEENCICIYHKGTYENLGESYSKIIKYIENNHYTIKDFPREC